MPEGFAPDGDDITAHTDDVTKHIKRLWGEPFRELALDVGRDPSNSNVAIARIVSEMRLAEETRLLREETQRTAEETRRMRIVATVAVIVALAVGVASVLVAAISN